MMFRNISAGLVLVLIGIAAIAANGNVVYSNDFQSVVGSQWSNTSTDITPVGDRRFLGQFSDDDAVSLSLNNLSAHNSVTIAFDLYVIQSWDGTSSDYGPDTWQLSVDNGPVLLNTTFSNTGDDGHMQSYSGSNSSGGEYDAQTGASEINTLGYEFYGDSVYNLSFTFNHTGDSLKLNFAGFGLQGVDDESWGLDNVTVSTASIFIPEPSTVAIFAVMSFVLLCQKKSLRLKLA
ncbi:MAG: hypothetical protein ABR969_04100 [Sedimentisphaerales bacterium]